MSVFSFSKRSAFDLFICFCSVLLVLIAPKTYSYNYCLTVHNIYIITVVYYVFKNRKDGFLSFNLLFSVSLYCTSFIYPVFIYNTSERYASLFSYDFDENAISYCTGVAYMAYCFLQLGLNRGRNANNNQATKYCKGVISKDSINIFSTFFLFSFVLFVLNNGLGFYADWANASLEGNDYIMGYVAQFLMPMAYSILYLAFTLPTKNCFAFRYALSVVGIYTLGILITGSRTIPLSIVIMTLFLYNDNVKRIQVTKLAVLGIAFFIVLVVVGELRGGGELITAESVTRDASDALKERQENIFSFADELTMCNRNLYFLVGTTETVGYTYGITLLDNFLSIIPFLRSLVSRLFGIPIRGMNSAEYNTLLSSGTLDERGLGTHAVADVYICWGILGVILIFYLYGYIIMWLKNNSDNVLYRVAYYVILSNAIYACRASIFNLNQIFWTVFFVYIVLKISGRKITYKPVETLSSR